MITTRPQTISARKRIALVAHDNKKNDLVAWAGQHLAELQQHDLFATGTTGKRLSEKLGLQVTRLQSGPLGGDQQIGARIVDGEINFLVFFWDPFEPLPHDPDVKALLRIAAVWNIPVACNQCSADFMLQSALMGQPYDRQVPDGDGYQNRPLA